MPRIRAENIETHKRLTRSQILAAAEQLFLENGYNLTSLGDIAAEIGIGRTTMYEYFTDKEQLLVALVSESLPRTVDQIVAAIPPGLTSRERLGELIVRHLEFIADESNLGTLVMREGPSLSRSTQEQIRSTHATLEKAMLAACRDGVASGEFRHLDPEQAAELVYHFTLGVARQLIRENDPKARVHELSDSLLDLLFSGLLA